MYTPIIVTIFIVIIKNVSVYFLAGLHQVIVDPVNPPGNLKMNTLWRNENNHIFIVSLSRDISLFI